MTPDKIRLREFIAEKFPNVESWPSIEESCIYTVCPIKSRKPVYQAINNFDQNVQYVLFSTFTLGIS